MYRLELVGTEKGIEIYSYGNLFDILPEIGISGDGLELTARIVSTPIEFVGDCIAECGYNIDYDENEPPPDEYIDYIEPMDTEFREIVK